MPTKEALQLRQLFAVRTDARAWLRGGMAASIRRFWRAMASRPRALSSRVRARRSLCAMPARALDAGSHACVETSREAALVAAQARRRCGCLGRACGAGHSRLRWRFAAGLSSSSRRGDRGGCGLTRFECPRASPHAGAPYCRPLVMRPPPPQHARLRCSRSCRSIVARWRSWSRAEPWARVRAPCREVLQPSLRRMCAVSSRLPGLRHGGRSLRRLAVHTRRRARRWTHALFHVFVAPRRGWRHVRRCLKVNSWRPFNRELNEVR